MNLFNELKRRNVFRVGGLYAVFGWALAQAASLLENALTLPGWFDAVVVSLLLIGFPLAIVFSWAYEMTSEGIKLTKDVPQDASIASKTGRKLDVALICAIGVLVVVIVGDRFIGPKGGAATVIAVSKGASADAVSAENSIAVLPFTDMSSDKDQEYFSDGISEELLNVLAQVQGLRVAGRTSSFAFKGQNKDLREIGEILNVGHIVEGSIRKSGNKIRITAQLIKAKDGYHQWSNTYDRDLTDIFAVQDEIAHAIVTEMSAALPALAAASEKIKPTARADIGAYDLFLLAREKMTQEGSKEAYEAAAKLLDEAIAQDPHYAPALAWRSYAASMLSEASGGVGDTPMAEALPVIKEYADRALAADPGSAEGLFALGSYYGQLTYAEGVQHLDKTIETLRKAVAIRPNFPQAQNDLAYFLDIKGNKAEALKILKEVLAQDPGLRDANVTYILGQVQLGRYDEAEAALERWSRVRTDQSQITTTRVSLLAARGRLADAWRMAQEVYDAGVADSNLDSRRFIVRFILHDGAWIVENTDGRRKAVGANLLGDKKRAIELVDADPIARMSAVTAMGSYVSVHYFAGDSRGTADYYDAEIKTPAAAVAAASSCACTILPLVLALREVQHKDFQAVLSAWKEEREQRRDLYAQSADWNSQMADIAALEGDFVAAKKYYAKAMDIGWRNPYFIDRGYRTFLPNDADFDALLARMKSLINEERKALGLSEL